MEDKGNVFDDALEALEAEAKAADAVDNAYAAAVVMFKEIEDRYDALRGTGSAKFDFDKIKDLVSNNKGAIMAAAAAFGIPVGLADSGAFSTITGLLGKVGGLFGIG